MPAVDPAFGGGLDPDGWLIDRLVNDYKELPEDDWVQIDITRRQWLVGMTAGTDILTAKAHPRKWWKHKAALMYWGANGEHRLRGAGALAEKMDEIILDNPSGSGTIDAPIFEFRAPGVGANLMKYDTWSDYAIKAYRFLAAANALAREKDIDEAKVFNLS